MEKRMLIGEYMGFSIYQVSGSKFESTSGHNGETIKEIKKKIKTWMNFGNVYASKY